MTKLFSSEAYKYCLLSNIHHISIEQRPSQCFVFSTNNILFILIRINQRTVFRIHDGFPFERWAKLSVKLRSCHCQGKDVFYIMNPRFSWPMLTLLFVGDDRRYYWATELAGCVPTVDLQHDNGIWIFQAGNNLLNGQLAVYGPTDTGIEGLRPEYHEVKGKHLQEVIIFSNRLLILSSYFYFI